MTVSLSLVPAERNRTMDMHRLACLSMVCCNVFCMHGDVRGLLLSVADCKLGYLTPPCWGAGKPPLRQLRLQQQPPPHLRQRREPRLRSSND